MKFKAQDRLNGRLDRDDERMGELEDILKIIQNAK